VESVMDKEVSESIKFEKQPTISFIVPIYDINPDLLKRCLLSLDDQDYENIEVICSFDGPNKDLEAVAEDFIQAKPEKFKKNMIEHAGSCAARNAGFNVSTGDIVSFFCSDYIAKPGMAKNWVDALLEHPDCGFAYGAYEYLSKQRAWYPSKPFDKWLLKQANYIDSGFPIWRKYVVPYDPAVKSLQDWDFWLSVTDKHPDIKGHYLGTDIQYMADPPRPKGLSYDSNANWTERVNFIKNKHEIKISSTLVTSIGATYHAMEMAKMLGFDYRDDTVRKDNGFYKALYLIGFYIKPDQPYNEHATIISHYKDRGAKIILHWVGADIYWLRKFPFEQLKYLIGALNKSCDVMLCENINAQNELKEYGINAEIVPIPPYNEYEVKPLPEKFRVAFMCTDRSDFDKYCKEMTMSIVRAMPDIEFAAYGDGGDNVRYANLTHVGRLHKEEWQKFVYENSALLRIVRHDTRPMANDEFILAGRDVITNVPAPYVEYINTRGNQVINEWDMFGTGFNAHRWPKTKKEVIQTIRRLRDVQKPVELRKEAAAEYSETLNKERYIKKLKELVKI